MEEATGPIGGDDANNFETVEYCRGEAAASGPPSWEEAGPAPTRGSQAHDSAEGTRETARPDSFETSACAECATTGCGQAKWGHSRPDGSGRCCKFISYGFCNSS